MSDLPDTGFTESDVATRVVAFRRERGLDDIGVTKRVRSARNRGKRASTGQSSTTGGITVSVISTHGVRVREDGSIRWDRKVFWSSDLIPFAGRWVSAKVPRREDETLTVDVGKAQIVCELLHDIGFSDPGAAREATKVKVGTHSLSDRVNALAKFIDHRIEANRQHRGSLFQRAVRLTLGDGEGVAHMFGRGRKDVAEEQVLDRDNMLMELGRIIFGHGGSRECEGFEASEAAAIHQRLSESRK